MKITHNIGMVLSLFLALPMASHATALQYFRSGDLQLVPGGGGDGTFGLDGAHYVMQATFTLANYSNYFGLAILVADSATVTITGASNPLNNATFNLNGNGQSLFFSPDYTGLNKAYLGYTPGGVPLSLFRQDGSLFNMHPTFEMQVTATGAAATPGTMAQASDFFPATPISLTWADFAGTSYNVINETISDTPPTQTSVPEPSSFILFATGLGIATARRYKRS